MLRRILGVCRFDTKTLRTVEIGKKFDTCKQGNSKLTNSTLNPVYHDRAFLKHPAVPNYFANDCKVFRGVRQGNCKGLVSLISAAYIQV